MSAPQTAGEQAALGVQCENCFHDYMRFKRHERAGLSCLRVVLLSKRVIVLCLLPMFLLILAAVLLALARAGFLLTLDQGLQSVQELRFPGLEVSLHTAMTALHHITVTLSSGHDPSGAQHPQPLIYALTDLNTEVI